MRKEEIEELFTNEQQFIKLKEKLLAYKQNDDLIGYLDLIVPINFVSFYRSFSREIKEIHDLIICKDYDFASIHNKIIILLDRIRDSYKPSRFVPKVLEKTFFSQEQDKRSIRINHGGGLRNIINFLLNKNEGYRLEGDSRTGLQVHHSDDLSMMHRAYDYYAFAACSRSLDVPAVLEAEIDSCCLLHADNVYEAALLPSMIKYLKNIKIIPLNAINIKTIKQDYPELNERVFTCKVSDFTYIFKHTINEQKFSKELSFSDYQAFLIWWSNFGEAEKAEIIELRRQLGVDFAGHPVVATSPAFYTPLLKDTMTKETLSSSEMKLKAEDEGQVCGAESRTSCAVLNP